MTNNVKIDYPKCALTSDCHQAGSIFAVVQSEPFAWTAMWPLEAKLPYEVTGCGMTMQNSDVWPAYAAVMIGDTSQYYLRALLWFRDIF